MESEKRNFYERILKYLSLFVLIPSFIGGFSQVILLCLISPLYVRLFSSSQALFDGLLSLLFFSLFITALYFVLSLNYRIENFSIGLRWSIKRRKRLRKFIKYLQNVICLNILFIPPLCIMVLFFPTHKLWMFIFVCAISFIISVVTSFFSFWLNPFRGRERNLRRKKLHKKENALNIKSIIYICFGLLMFLNMVIQMNSTLENTINSQNAICLFKNKYETKSCPKIRYFNDKYIFATIIDTNGNRRNVFDDFKITLNKVSCDCTIK